MILKKTKLATEFTEDTEEGSLEFFMDSRVNTGRPAIHCFYAVFSVNAVV